MDTTQDITKLEVIREAIAKSTINLATIIGVDAFTKNDIQVIKYLGEGSQAIVVLIEVSGSPFVAKIYKLYDSNIMKHIKREIDVSLDIWHIDGVCKCMGYIYALSYTAIIIEYIDNATDLFDYAYVHEKHTYEDLLTWAIMLCDILYKLHGEGYVHLDLKLENILIDSKKELYLIDFGLARKIGTELEEACGSLEYLPVEFVKKQEYYIVTTAVDVWCLGVILWTLMEDWFPFVHVKGKNVGNNVSRRIRLKNTLLIDILENTNKCVEGSQELSQLLISRVFVCAENRISILELKSCITKMKESLSKTRTA